MSLRTSSHWSIAGLRFATLPAVPPPLLREIFQAFQLRPPAGGVESPLAYPVLLRSADDSWAVRLELSSLALETRADEPYDHFVQRLAKIATIALPHLDTDFFTRATLRTIRSLPLSEAMEGTRAIAEQAYRFKMAMTSTGTGRSPAGHLIVQETVGPSRGLCTRDLAIYGEAVESSCLESVLKGLVAELSEFEHKPELGGIELEPDIQSAIDRDRDDVVELPLDSVSPSIEIGGFAPVIVELLPSASNIGFGLTRSEPHDEVAIVNDNRIRLLAKKYAGTGFSREDEARLEILQERILHLLPSVDQHDFERLEELAAVTRRVHERHLERMNRLGLAK